MIAARIGKPIKVMLAVQLIGALSGAEVISGSAPRNLVIQGKRQNDIAKPIIKIYCYFAHHISTCIVRITNIIVQMYRKNRNRIKPCLATFQIGEVV